MVEYIYDAWGNHIVTPTEEAYAELSQLNPFRYRGYYYDPEVGRFITIDDLSYLDPDTINGLNLYAYCGNNPVMNIDPNGNFFLSLLFAVIAGAAIGGVINGVCSGAKGDSFWGSFLSGALIGGALGAAFFLGGATMLAIVGKAVAGFVVVSTAAANLGLLVGMFAGSTLLAVGAGMGAYAINESMNGREVDKAEMVRHGIITGLNGAGAFIAGMALAATGVLKYILKGVHMAFAEKMTTMIVRSICSFVFQFPWKKALSS